MSLNTRSPAVKRLMKEATELSKPTELYYTQPIEDNIFEWHFTIRGPSDTDFSGGVYHGRIILPAEYPMKPPSIVFLTPNGRFKVNEKICLSISGHHPETWQPSWSIRTALLALIGFMPSNGEGALGSLDYTPEERKKLAKQSLAFKCSTCNIENDQILLKLTEESNKISEEAKELASQINFKNAKPPQESVSNVEQELNIRQRLTQTNTNEYINHATTSSSSGYSPYSIVIFILCLLFIVLFVRRLVISFLNYFV